MLLSWTPLKRLPFSRNEPDARLIGIQQRPESIPFDLEQPIRMGERVAQATERHGLKLRQGHSATIKKNATRSRGLWHSALLTGVFNTAANFTLYCFACEPAATCAEDRASL
jgi:hypothetical protein